MRLIGAGVGKDSGTSAADLVHAERLVAGAVAMQPALEQCQCIDRERSGIEVASPFERIAESR